MSYGEQQSAWQQPQSGNQGNQGLGQAAFGQQYGPQQFNPQQFNPQMGLGQQAYGGWPQQAWGQQRQLSQQEIGEVVRQLVPILPHILAQAQQAQYQPQAAFGQQRQLSPQDVNEVVRQILPVLPQIAGILQNQPQYASQQLPQMQAAFGQGGANNQFGGQQRQLSQQDVQEVARQLTAVLPQVLGAFQNQQRI